jgi:hypothetical protein
MSAAWQEYRNERARIDRLVASGALRRADAGDPRAIALARRKINEGQTGWREECRRLGIPAPSKISARRAFEWWLHNHPAAGHARLVADRFGLEASLIQPDLFGEPRERGCRRRSKGRGVAA